MKVVKEFPKDDVGILLDKTKYSKEIEYFKFFFSQDIYEEITSESNRQFTEKIFSSKSFIWQNQFLKCPIGVYDFKAYLPVLMFLSIVKLQRKRIY